MNTKKRDTAKHKGEPSKAKNHLPDNPVKDQTAPGFRHALGSRIPRSLGLHKPERTKSVQ